CVPSAVKREKSVLLVAVMLQGMVYVTPSRELLMTFFNYCQIANFIVLYQTNLRRKPENL
nr:hypothetical protein [Spirochaetales bacterium]